MDLSKEQQAWLDTIKSKIADGSASKEEKALYSKVISKVGTGMSEGLLGAAKRGSGEDRYSFGAGASGLGSGKYRGQQAPVLPGDEMSASDEIAATEQLTEGETEGVTYDYKDKTDEFHRVKREKLWKIWDELPQEEKDEVIEMSKSGAFARGALAGVSPIPPSWLKGPKGLAKLQALEHFHGGSYGAGELAGLGVGLLAGGVGGYKVGKVGADIALAGPRAALRESSRRLNKSAKTFDNDIKRIKAGDDRILKVSGETAEEAIERLSIQRDRLRAYDRKMVDQERRFGIKQNRELRKAELEERALNERENYLRARKDGTTYSPDIIRASLGDKADDVYKNVLEGDTTSRGKVVNIWQQYVAEPFSSNTKAALENLPGKVIGVVSGLGGSAISSFIYGFEHFYNNGYSSEDAAAAAFDYASEFAPEDLVVPGAAVGIAEDITSGALSKNKGGLLSRKLSTLNREGHKPKQAYAIAKDMGYNRGGLLGNRRRQDPEGRYADRVNQSDTLSSVADFVPIVGDVKAAKEIWDEMQKPSPNWTLVGTLGGAALIGLVPGIGDAAASAIKAGAKKGKGLLSSRISASVGDSAGEGLKSADLMDKTRYTSKKFTGKYESVSGVQVPKTFIKQGNSVEDWMTLSSKDRAKMRWETEGKPVWKTDVVQTPEQIKVMSRVFFDAFENFKGQPDVGGYHRSGLINGSQFATQGLRGDIGSPMSVVAHETGHAVDSLVPKLSGNTHRDVSLNVKPDSFGNKKFPDDVPEDVMEELNAVVGLRRGGREEDLHRVDVNLRYAKDNPTRPVSINGKLTHGQEAIDLLTAERKRLEQTSDADFGARFLKSAYQDSQYPAEMMADAFALLAENPSKFKTMAPKAWKLIQKRVNNDEFVKQVIETQSNAGVPTKEIVGALVGLGVSSSIINNAFGTTVVERSA